MKKEIMILMVLMLASQAYATLDVKLISYKPETQEAKILLSNTGTTDYTGITLYIEGTADEMKGTVLKPKTGIVLPKKIYPGQRNISVKTDQGWYSEMIYFSAPTPQTVKPDPIQNNLAIIKTTMRDKVLKFIRLNVKFIIVGAAVLALAITITVYAGRKKVNKTEKAATRPVYQKPKKKAKERNTKVFEAFEK